ncbi:MAG: hypothetical protein ABMB14_10150 [Myxococcota bacterium]
MLAVCLLALALPAGAQVPAPPSGTSAPLAPAMTDEQRAAAFTTWATSLASGNRDAAIAALTDILDDPSKAPVHGEAYAHLGEAFAELDLKLAAIGAMGRGLALDPVHTATVAPKALALVQELGESGLVGEAVGKNVGIQVEPAARNELALVAARYQLDHASYGPALGILMMGSKDGEKFEDVELMRGIVLSQQDKHADAIAPLLTALALGIQHDRDEKWVNTANLDVARAYYSSGNYGQAITYYAKIERSSDWWLDAQFERAWAHFRGNDVNGALAMLYTHDSPFFTDFFYPEADLLRAYSLFVMCKFTDATKEMDAFAAKYEPIQKELAGLSLSPKDAYADVVAFRDDQTTRIPTYVLRPFRHEQRLTDAMATVERSEDELKTIGKKLSGRGAAVATELVETQRDARIEVEGQRVLGRIDAAKATLGSMLEGIEITRLDVLNLEAQMYERAAATGVLDYGSHLAALKDMKKKRRGFHVWPWQGEYWADELGWFVFSARPDCPESMARGEGTDTP